eukprot:scaffold183388_cov14-Tisochrysis_lutea.AAC.1
MSEGGKCFDTTIFVFVKCYPSGASNSTPFLCSSAALQALILAKEKEERILLMPSRLGTPKGIKRPILLDMLFLKPDHASHQ